MSLILNIDTATEIATVSLAKDGIILQSNINEVQKDHAGFLHPAIERIIKASEIKMHELDAIAVTSGPGSYTGIRVGMASAKGFCTALNIPLITINSLELLAKAVILSYDKTNEPVLLCPMIDARRMEVFTALYDDSLKEVLKPCAMILDSNSFHDFSENHTLINFGSGVNKWRAVVKLRNFIYIENVNSLHAMAYFSYQRYVARIFADAVYSEPLYLKEFFNNA